MSDYKDKKVLVLGLGLSGKALVAFLKKRQANVIAYDDKIKDRASENIFSNVEQINFKSLDLIASSPGIGSHPLLEKASKWQIPVMGEVEIAARELFERECIGITGTNGKSTTVSLIAHILNELGVEAYAVGNIGVPLSFAIDAHPKGTFVIELSSFQIDQLKTPCLDQALILNISPDHLDRYKTMDCYAQSKFSIQNFLKKEGTFWTSEALHKKWPFLISKKLYCIFDSQQNKVHYPKNVAPDNFYAALAILKKRGFAQQEIQNAALSFRGLEHRMEYVGEIDGIEFYNDSKATNVEAVLNSLSQAQKPLNLIMGGQDKGLDYCLLKAYFLGKVKSIYLIGSTSQKMAKAFEGLICVHLCKSLEQAVEKAFYNAKSGEQIWLSPAASSFDMFKNFEERGRVFKELVEQLKGVKNESP